MSINNFFEGGEALKSNQLKKELDLKISEIKTLSNISFFEIEKRILLLKIEYSAKIKKLTDLNF